MCLRTRPEQFPGPPPNSVCIVSEPLVPRFRSPTMKKFLSLLAVLALGTALTVSVGCGGDKKTEPTKKPT